MPKNGPSAMDWMERLKQFAAGTFSFQRGQRPSSSSYWATKLKDIEDCPRHRALSGKDVLGRSTFCKCGFHHNMPKTTPSSTISKAPPKPTPTNISQTTKSNQPQTPTKTKILPVINKPSSNVQPSPKQEQQVSPASTKEPLPKKFPPVSANNTIIVSPDKVNLKGMPLNQNPPIKESVKQAPTPSPTKASTKASPQKSPPIFPRQPNDYSNRVLKGWLNYLQPGDQQWVGQQLFTGSTTDEKLKLPLKHWYYPPGVIDANTRPDPDKYCLRRFFLWAPRKTYLFDFKCPKCAKSLHSKGFNQKLRLVLDVKDFYYLGTEFLGCTCGATFLSTDSRLIKQLPYHIQVKFPAVLTYKYACDHAVISLMKSRTLGNSSHALQNNLREMHSEKWLKSQVQYLSACEKHKAKISMFGNQSELKYKPFVPLRTVPSSAWLLSAYVRDVWSRIDTCKAEITSVFGEILKIDSTKKILNKLAGEARQTASWVTNVANEYGAVLQSVVTSSESNESLEPMARGLEKRYQEANVKTPLVLYTDRDCCSNTGESRYQRLFPSWENLIVRLDIWHFMRRIAFGCTSESHPLYGPFMSQLSGCIFEWDPKDYDELLAAKKEELKKAGMKSPSTQAAVKAIKKEELALHCRRKTRGTDETTKAIEELILGYTGCTDSLGVALFKPEMVSIYKEQKRHIPCIQDPEGISLYTEVRRVTKGKRLLPKFRCARGSTSLEAFHHHVHQFIPGTRANAVNFQAYLLEGLSRWNAARKDEVKDNSLSKVRSFNVQLVSKFNTLHAKIYGEPYNKRVPPSIPTGEHIGIEYLYRQTDMSFDFETVEKDIDNGTTFEDEGIEEDLPPEDIENVNVPGTLEETMEEDITEDQNQAAETSATETTATDSRGIPGWENIDALAQALVNCKGISLSDNDAKLIINLYQKLDEFDKRPLEYKAVIRKPVSGRFCQRKRGGYDDVVKMKRSFVTASSPALPPSKSRLVEAICTLLCQSIQSATYIVERDKRRVYTSRWSLILKEYRRIQARFLNSQDLEKVGITLFNINETTLRTWVQNSERSTQIKLLLKGRKVPKSIVISNTTSLEPRKRSTDLQGQGTPLVFPEQLDRTGQAKRKYRKKKDESKIETGNLQIRPRPPVLLPALQQQHHLFTQTPSPIYHSSTITRAPPPLKQPLQLSSPPQPPPPPPPQPTTSLRTYYRHLKKSKSVATLGETKTIQKQRKPYCCRKCGKQANDGYHKQVKGATFCPHVAGESFEEFKERKINEWKEKNKKDEI